MKREEHIQYFRIALALQNIGIDNEMSDRIIETFEVVKQMKGKFSVKDACEIQYRMDKKYSQKAIEIQTPQ